MMMALDDRIEPCHGIGMKGLLSGARLDQRFQDTIDRGSGQARNALPYRVIDIVRGRVIAPGQKLLPDGVPLYGERQSAPPAEILEIGRFLSAVHRNDLLVGSLYHPGSGVKQRRSSSAGKHLAKFLPVFLGRVELEAEKRPEPYE